MTGKERAHIKIESSKKFSTPPGFISCTSFLLRKVVDGSLDIGGDPQKEPVPLNITSNIFGEETFGRSLRSRPWILSDDHNQEEVVSYLCDKVETRPSRDVSNANNLEEAAIFRPSEEEFSNTLAYIESIRLRAEPHGICRIIPPPTWQPPCHLKENNIWEDSTFRTQIQRFADLRNQNFPNKKPKYDKNGPVKRRQASKGMTDDSRCSPIREFNSNCPEPGVELTLEMFKRHADDFKEQHFSMKDNVSRGDNSTTLDKQLQPSVEDIEGEYRWIVENCTEEVKVLYADDTDTRVLGSGFPSMTTSACHVYKESGWNLKNTPRLPGSLLSLEDSKSSSVLVPRLQVGMCFSTHFWKVEEHLLYSLCYMHMGAPKIWYGVPARFSMKCKTIMRNCVPDSLVELNDLQHSVVPKLLPSALKLHGIPVYRCIQYPREFVIVFPGAYHSGMDCGFNCTEIVNFAPFDWLSYGETAVDLYREQKKKTIISYDKILLGAAKEAVRAQWEISLARKSTPDNLTWKDTCGNDGILTKALKSRVMSEGIRREYLCPNSQFRIMDKSFDAISKKDCCICFYDLHLSAAFCSCSPDRFSCLNHAKQLCFCGWSEKIFLFRYDMEQLNDLIEALEGKLSAVYKWAKEELKLSLVSNISKKNISPQTSREEPHRFKGIMSIANGFENTSASSLKEKVKARLLQANSLEKREAREAEVKKPRVPIVSNVPIDIASESSSCSSSSESDDSDFEFLGSILSSTSNKRVPHLEKVKSSQLKKSSSSNENVGGFSMTSSYSAFKNKKDKG